MLIKRNKYFSAIEEEEYLDQKEFNSKAQKARRKKWEVKEGLKAAQADPTSANTSQEVVNQAKGGHRALGIHKPVSIEETAVNLARHKNRPYLNSLEYRQMKMKTERGLNPKATFKDTMENFEWENAIESMNLRKENKEKEILAKKAKAAKLKNMKKAGKVALGTAAVIGTGVVAKKLYDRKKKKNADQGNK